VAKNSKSVAGKYDTHLPNSKKSDNPLAIRLALDNRPAVSADGT
jgi:hypothetical protein